MLKSPRPLGDSYGANTALRRQLLLDYASPDPAGFEEERS